MTDQATPHDPSAPETPASAGSTVLTGTEGPPPVPGDPAARLLVEEAAVHRRPHPEGGEHGAHPTDRQYMLIALILAAITAVSPGTSSKKTVAERGSSSQREPRAT